MNRICKRAVGRKDRFDDPRRGSGSPCDPNPTAFHAGGVEGGYCQKLPAGISLDSADFRAARKLLAVSRPATIGRPVISFTLCPEKRKPIAHSGAFDDDRSSGRTGRSATFVFPRRLPA